MKNWIITTVFALFVIGAVYLFWPHDNPAPAAVNVPAPALVAVERGPDNPLSVVETSLRAATDSSAPLVPQSTKAFWEDFERQTVLDFAESGYDAYWKGFVDSLDVPPSVRAQVKDVMVYSAAYNMELSDLATAGEITEEERLDAIITPEQIGDTLSGIVSEEQVQAYLRADLQNTEAFFEGLAEWELQQQANDEVGILDAASRGDSASVQAYIDSGVNVDMMSLDGSNTALIHAVMNNNLEIARQLVDAGADVNLASANEYPTTPLLLAAGMGDASMVRLLAEVGADVNFTPEGGMSPLRSAAFRGYTDAVAELVRAGADATGTDGARALADAIEYDDVEMQRILIEARGGEQSEQ